MGCRAKRYGPEVTRVRASGSTLNERRRYQSGHRLRTAPTSQRTRAGGPQLRHRRRPDPLGLQAGGDQQKRHDDERIGRRPRRAASTRARATGAPAAEQETDRDQELLDEPGQDEDPELGGLAPEADGDGREGGGTRPSRSNAGCVSGVDGGLLFALIVWSRHACRSM